MDLLTQTLTFSVIQPNRAQDNIFSLVIDGRLTALAQMIQSFKPDDVTKIINSKDTDGKTPLFYAWYYPLIIMKFLEAIITFKILSCTC